MFLYLCLTKKVPFTYPKWNAKMFKDQMSYSVKLCIENVSINKVKHIIYLRHAFVISAVVERVTITSLFKLASNKQKNTVTMAYTIIKMNKTIRSKPVQSSTVFHVFSIQ